MYDISAALPHEVRLLPDIERRAAERFRGLAVLPDIPNEGISVPVLAAAQRQGLLWLARDVDRMPIGFALVQELGAGLHLEEMDVLPEYGRRGVGGRLVEAVCRHARSRNKILTLCTFRDVPWNAPFYARLGFEELEPHELRPALLERVAEEEARGLDRRLRVVMQFKGGATVRRREKEHGGQRP